MAFFGNAAVNRLNFHYAIHAFAMYGGGAFLIAFLLKAGLSPSAALLAVAAVCVGRFLVRPLVVPAALHFGLTRVLAAGTLLQAANYVVIGEIDGIGLALLGYVIVGALADTAYWTTYHAAFAQQGDDGHRGHQIGLREAAATLVSIISPLITGALLTSLGPQAAFGLSAAATAISVWPLWGMDSVPVPRVAPGALRKAMVGAKLFLSDGLAAAGFFVWHAALFVSLDSNALAFGAALAVAALVGAAASLALGRAIDSGFTRRAAALAYGSFALVTVLRAVATGEPGLAVAANALGAIAASLYVPAFMAVVYRFAKASPCVLRFHVAAEGGWDIGCTAGLCLAALLLSLGVNFGAVQLLALGAFGLGWLWLTRAGDARP